MISLKVLVHNVLQWDSAGTNNGMHFPFSPEGWLEAEAFEDCMTHHKGEKQ